MSDWVGLLLRSGLILLAAELLRWLGGRAGPAYRHSILRAAFALLLLWPLLAAALPEYVLPLHHPGAEGAHVSVRQTAAFLAAHAATYHRVPWAALIWSTGVATGLLRLVLGWLGVSLRLRQARPILDRSLEALAAEACAASGMQTFPRLLVSASGPVPYTFGLLRPAIVLPPEASVWDPQKQRTVLLHEIAHLSRHDLWWQSMADIATCLWWFQPLCWWSRFRLRSDSEHACDAAVLAAGVLPSAYAADLLAIASNREQQRHAFASPALPMARGGKLEGRIHAILQGSGSVVHRAPSMPVALLTALTVTASALTVTSETTKSPGGPLMKRTLMSSLLASAGLSAATVGGSVYDPAGIAVPNAHVSLYNPDTSNTQETTTNADGKFTFESLQAGSYILHLDKPGVGSLYREFNVQADSEVHRGLVLDSTGKPASETTAEPSPAAGNETLGNPVRVRGTVAQANLVKKVQPVYPAAAKTAHVQGTVTLEVTISTDGSPEDLRVVSSPSDDLTQSALEAVRQWRYRPTLLNGQPVAIVTSVIVNYTLSE